MDRGKYLEPNFQKFWKEIIEKEQSVRLNWNAKYNPFLNKTQSVFDPDRTSSDDEEESEEELRIRKPEILAETMPRVEDLSPPHVDVEEIIPKPSRTSMKPVSLQDRSLLYDGTSKEGLRGEGRAQYLRYRKKLGPEDKYYHPVASSWDYGWRYGKPGELSHPEHPRVHIVKQTFYRRNGNEFEIKGTLPACSRL